MDLLLLLTKQSQLLWVMWSRATSEEKVVIRRWGRKKGGAEGELPGTSIIRDIEGIIIDLRKEVEKKLGDPVDVDKQSFDLLLTLGKTEGEKREQAIGRIRWKKEKRRGWKCLGKQVAGSIKARGTVSVSPRNKGTPLLQEEGRLASTDLGHEGIGQVKMLTPAKFWDAGDVYTVRTKRNGNLKLFNGISLQEAACGWIGTSEADRETVTAKGNAKGTPGSARPARSPRDEAQKKGGAKEEEQLAKLGKKGEGDQGQEKPHAIAGHTAEETSPDGTEGRGQGEGCRGMPAGK